MTTRDYKSASDWLEKWDSGQTVWSVEMGGLGPGYEQCIQIMAAEMLRCMIENNMDASKWHEKDEREKDTLIIETFPPLKEKMGQLGVSGAQYGAALNIASVLYRRGPAEALSDRKVKDRLIQVSKAFPQ